MKFNRNKLIVHRILFLKAPAPCLIWVDRAGSGLTEKNKHSSQNGRFVQPGNGENLG